MAALTLNNVAIYSWIGDTWVYSVTEGDVDGDGGFEIVSGGFSSNGTRSLAQLHLWNFIKFFQFPVHNRL